MSDDTRAALLAQLAANEREIAARCADIVSQRYPQYAEAWRQHVNRLDAWSDNLCDELGISRPRYNPLP